MTLPSTSQQQTPPRPSTVVAIVSYRRPDELAETLRSLEKIESVSFDVLVVDNDEDGSARHVASASPLPLSYVLETTPGIAAARNAALDHCRGRYKHLAFIDDDETASPDWLKALQETADQYAADAVFGPVLPLFPKSSPRWPRHLHLFDRPSGETGGRVKWPATNNVLIGHRILDSGLRFDEAFSLTGGSDSMFFEQAGRNGAVMAWCQEAVVYEHVPPQRTTLRWIWRRGVRLGNVSARMAMIRGRSRTWIASIAVARALATPLVFLLDSARNGHLHGASLLNLPKAIGMLDVLRDRLTIEYKRSQ